MAKFLLALLVLAAFIFGLGLYLDWFDLRVQEDKIAQDLNTAEEEARQAAREVRKEARELGREARKLGQEAHEEARLLAETHTVRGEVVQVDPADERFVVRTSPDKELIILTDASSVIRQNKEMRELDDLQPGDTVTVAYQETEGKNYATTVTIRDE